MRSWRSELLSILTVLAIPAAIALVFPYVAVDFRAAVPSVARRLQVAFVTLTPEAEAAAVRAAKTSWRSGEDDYSRAELRLGELPEPDAAPILDVGTRARAELPVPALPQLPGYLPSSAAAAPATLPQDGMLRPDAAFSKPEMLKIH